MKESVFPFSKFPGQDILLGPEMRSTGEVMGIGEDWAWRTPNRRWRPHGVAADGPHFHQRARFRQEERGGAGRGVRQARFRVVRDERHGEGVAAGGVKVETLYKLAEGRRTCST